MIHNAVEAPRNFTQEEIVGVRLVGTRIPLWIIFKEVSINGQHAVRKQWTGSILGPNDAVPKAIKPIIPAKIANKSNTTVITETIGEAAMDGTEIGSDKTVKEAATYVDQNDQKLSIENFDLSKSLVKRNIFFD